MLKINNTLDGFLKDVEIKGNTIQDAENLADIRSVGDKVEGQELYEIPVVSTGKNLFNKFFKSELEKCSIVTISEDGIITLNGTLSTNYVFNVIIPKGEYFPSQTTDFKNFLHAFWWGSDIIFDIGSRVRYEKDTTIQCYIPSGTYNNVACKFQFEYGATKTEYEEPKEDKLTILSPVQLEKVGDVADRIICKDGVWGVEKNVKTVVYNGSESWFKVINKNTSLPPEYRLTDAISDYKLFGTYGKGISNKYSFIGNEENCWVSTKEGFGLGSSVNKGILYVCCNVATLDEFKTHINKFSVKYITEKPQFIPLPHDQQIKLRTFANKTNISFGCEIEGTIKAQVPKSLGATVNTHTEQIGNLSKELDRVKKLEESTVSTVTTESDFTTVEATSNGYFEDVKLEGKTLVNLARTKIQKVPNFVTMTLADNLNAETLVVDTEVGKTYTVIKQPSNRFMIAGCDNTEVDSPITKILDTPSGFDETKSYTVKVVATNSKMVIYVANPVSNINVMILEGDHTQNPPSFFEGLMSVGQDVDEVSVESVNGNLFDGELEKGDILFSSGQNSDTSLDERIRSVNYISVKKDTTYYINKPSVALNVSFYDYKKQFISAVSTGASTFNFTTPNNCSYIRFMAVSTDLNYNYQIKRIDNFINYTKYQSDKKPLLYYNPSTETWEKPILRQWDSIEKHADGKYYYHKRSEEVVLNGSESWWKDLSIGANTTRYGTKIQNAQNTNTSNKLVCNLFACSGVTTYGTDVEDTQIYDNSLYVRINTSKAQDVEGFKAWLQDNPTTVVYQLAQEEVYECTNIDLITYENETNYVVNCGAIVPKTTLKVHNNISNVVSLLQKKVSLLESNVKASQEVQDMMILETDMRMLDIELALMEFMPMELNLGENTMLRSATYFNFIKGHIVNETYSKDYLENVMNKYLATNRLTQEEYDELYKILYPQNYDIALPIEE